MKDLEIHLKRCFAVVICTLFCCSAVLAQQNTAYLEYIQKYSPLAVDQMRRHSIPASITLSQGLLESAAGQSTLATQAYNHFGIKVGTGWNGPYVVRDDDAKGEHFRKYNSVAESYEDHSLFLKKPRYSGLFNLELRDYVGWAHGLKAAGYATNPSYAESLIRIIENYRLYEYDAYQSTTQKGGVVAVSDRDNFYATHPVQQCNKNYYIVMQRGDNLESIAKLTGIRKRKLLSYNDLPSIAEPSVGSVIFLEKKQKRADKYFKGRPHVLQPGQSLYDVSQMYGIRLKSLYKLNKFAPDYMPMAGQTIRLY